MPSDKPVRRARVTSVWPQFFEGDVADLAERHARLLTGNAAEVAAGTRLHKDKAEAQAACSFATAMFKDLATMDPTIAERIMRQLYAPPPAENPGG